MAGDARLQGRRAGLGTWLLAAACGWAALLWLGALLGMGGRLEQGEPVAAGGLPVPAAARPDRIGPLSQYASAAARPLFTRDRRPRSFLATAPESGADGAPTERLDFVLSGVLISPQVRLAVLQPSGGGDSQRVQVGQSPEGAAGWRLVDVQPRRAVFEGGSGQAVLELRTFGVAGPPAPMAADAANAAAAAAARRGRAPVPNAVNPPVASDPQDAQSTEARVEAIRRRIEARRAQQQNRNTTPVPPPAGGTPRQ